LKSAVSNGDVIFQGNDDGSTVTALTLDMSLSGTAVFNHNVGIGQTPTAFNNWRVLELKAGSAGAMVNYENSSSARVAALAYDEGSTQLRIQTMVNAPIRFEPNNAVALTLDGSQNATFEGTINGSKRVTLTNTSSEHLRLAYNNTYYWDITRENVAGDLIFDSSNVSGVSLTLGAANKKLTTAGGILFGTDTADDNTLDDYEEGTFTPTLTPNSGSYSMNSAYSKLGYTKIGRVVVITGQLVIASESSATGTVTLGNLPFEMANDTLRTSQTRPSIHVYASGGGAPNAGYYPAFIAFNEGQSSGTIIVTYNSTFDSTPADWFSGGSDFFVNFAYHTNQ
jgi:hypothetical protein